METTTRQFPWATTLGVVGLVLATLGAVGAVLAGASAIDGARNPESFGTLGAVALVMFSSIPSAVAMLIALVQGANGWASRGRTRTTVTLAALAPIGLAVAVVGSLVG